MPAVLLFKKDKMFDLAAVTLFLLMYYEISFVSRFYIV